MNIHTYLSYDDLQRAGIMSSEETALQYLIDVDIIRPHQYCDGCNRYMELKSCSTSKYTDGCCWTCRNTEHHRSVRADSILENRSMKFSTFIHTLWLFCNRTSVCDTSRILSLNAATVRSLFKAFRQCMSEDQLVNGVARKIGGPGHIIEIDESKFGKRKYNRGRRVVGKWVLGGYCRTTNQCFLVECSGNRRNHHTLLRLIKHHVAAGTTILTDKWRGYTALSHHGYVHFDVNHRQGFVDPTTGVHTNTCEGMWFHAKKAMARGQGRVRSNSSKLSAALGEFMWLKTHNLTRSDADVRRFFNHEMPQLMGRIFG